MLHPLPKVSDLDLLLAEGIIDEICGRLKSGKEADISAVRRGDQILAAKVYKDRATRSFKNNADYKEGRKVRNTRTQRAIESGGKFGRDSEEQAWKSAEADALYKLAGSGVRVPAPVMFYEGVLLMELIAGADGQVAPRLIDVAIPPDDAMGIYADLLSQIISMLCLDLIHGDLSPYNILLAADGPTIIDFPQVVSAAHSTRAEYFFLRDFDNVLRFLVTFDPTLAVHRADGRAVWRAYVGRELTPQFVPPPPPPPSQQRREERRFDRPRNDGRGPQRGNNRGPQQRNDGRGPQGNDNRGPQQPNGAGGSQQRDAGGLLQRSDRSFATGGSQPGGRNDRSFDARGSQPDGDRGSQQRTDNRGPHPAAGDRGPQSRNDRTFDTRGSQPGPQQRNDGGVPPSRNDGRGAQPTGDPQQREDGRGPSQRNDRSSSQPGGDRGSQQRNDDRGPPRNDSPGPQAPSAGSAQPRRSYGERFAGDRAGTPDRGPQEQQRSAGRGPQPFNDDRGPQPVGGGTQPQPRNDSRDDFDWSQPRRTAAPPRNEDRGPQPRNDDRGAQQRNDDRGPPQRNDDRGPPQRNDNRGPQRANDGRSSQQPNAGAAQPRRSQAERFAGAGTPDRGSSPSDTRARSPGPAAQRNDRPRASGPAPSMPPPRAPRARVDPRPPPPAGGHRRRPKRRS